MPQSNGQLRPPSQPLRRTPETGTIDILARAVPPPINQLPQSQQAFIGRESQRLGSNPEQTLALYWNNLRGIVQRYPEMVNPRQPPTLDTISPDLRPTFEALGDKADETLRRTWGNFMQFLYGAPPIDAGV